MQVLYRRSVNVYTYPAARTEARGANATRARAGDESAPPGQHCAPVRHAVDEPVEEQEADLYGTAGGLAMSMSVVPRPFHNCRTFPGADNLVTIDGT